MIYLFLPIQTSAKSVHRPHLDLIYELEEENEFIEDMETLAEGLKLLQYDYLGGSGSRGYGKVGFQDLYAEVVVGEVADELMDQCNKILEEAAGE